MVKRSPCAPPVFVHTRKKKQNVTHAHVPDGCAVRARGRWVEFTRPLLEKVRMGMFEKVWSVVRTDMKAGVKLIGSNDGRHATTKNSNDGTGTFTSVLHQRRCN